MILYGIKNCDKVRAAKKQLDAKSIDYSYHDFRDDGLTPTLLKKLIEAVGADQLINKRSTTWKQLPEDIKKTPLNQQQAEQLLLENPTLIKRPVLDYPGGIHVGFDNRFYDGLE